MAPAAWGEATVESDMAALLKVRAHVNESIEPLRAAGKLGKSLDASVTLNGASADATFQILEKHRDFLPELFIVSHVTLAPAMGAVNSSIRPCSELGLARCPRCLAQLKTYESTVSLLHSIRDEDLPSELRCKLKAFFTRNCRN